MSVIEVNHLTKDYGFGRGVFDVSINVEQGEVFGFLGPNGAGKSTTIRHLMGFSRPGSGEVKIFGEPTFKKYYEILKKVGYIPGEIALPAGLNGNEFIKMMRDLTGVYNDEQLKILIDLFELDDASLRGDLKRMSLGVKRKLAIITAFMSDPDVLILDEPTSGLDPVMQERFVNFIHKEKARGKTILLSSHIFSEINNTCDRIAIIKDGKIVSEFIANDLKHASRKYYTIDFKTENDAKTFLEKSAALPTFMLLSNEGCRVHMSIEDSDLNKALALMPALSVVGFGNRNESLQDYFMKFYKEDKDFKGAIE